MLRRSEEQANLCCGLQIFCPGRSVGRDAVSLPRKARPTLWLARQFHPRHTCRCAPLAHAAWGEYIPQRDHITTSRQCVENGWAYSPTSPGLDIAWDWSAIAAQQFNDNSIK